MKSSNIDMVKQPMAESTNKKLLDEQKQTSEVTTLPDEKASTVGNVKNQMYVDSPNPLTDDDIRSLPTELRYDSETGEPLYPDIDGPEIILSQAEIDEMNAVSESEFGGPEIRLSQVEIDEMNAVNEVGDPEIRLSQAEIDEMNEVAAY